MVVVVVVVAVVVALVVVVVVVAEVATLEVAAVAAEAVEAAVHLSECALGRHLPVLACPHGGCLRRRENRWLYQKRRHAVNIEDDQRRRGRTITKTWNGCLHHRSGWRHVQYHECSKRCYSITCDRERWKRETIKHWRSTSIKVWAPRLGLSGAAADAAASSCNRCHRCDKAYISSTFVLAKHDMLLSCSRCSWRKQLGMTKTRCGRRIMQKPRQWLHNMHTSTYYGVCARARANMPAT